MKYCQFFSVLALSLSAASCAVTSGLQTYDIPSEGVYKTDLGTTVNVVKISQETLPAIQPAQIDYQREYAPLFKSQQSIYRLSPGDVLSIQLWAYPEITPPVNSISNEQSVQANGYPIDQTGYIQFPLVGRYKAAGKTLAQVNRELHSQLARFLKIRMW